MRRLLLGCLIALALIAVAVSAPPLLAQGYTWTSATTASLYKLVTVTSATPATQRMFYIRTNLTPPTTMAVAAGGSIASIRGEVNLTTGKSFTSGFAYGVQGKAVLAGTVAESDAARFTGVLGQTDTTGATTTAGQISAVWADLQGNATVTNAQTYPLRVSNSMSVSATALALFVGRATYAFDISDLGNADFLEDTAGTSAGQCAQTGGVVFAKALKVRVNNTGYWIPLCTAK